MKKQIQIEGKVPYGIDIPVLLIFFCRADKFAKVFEQVKAARPSRLYLYQDGPRNEGDWDGILQCRDTALQIDWNCTVHMWYQEENVGCDPSGFLAQSWMFGQEEMGIVLEDDVVPSQSFFPYCKELLEKYKDDERINIICGMNNMEVSEHIKDSYLFTTKGSCWGWASWKRVATAWDEKYPWLDSEQELRNLKNQIPKKREYKRYLHYVKTHKDSGKAHFETIEGMDLYLYNRLNIVPKHNMITNIGIGGEATHTASDIRRLPKRSQRLFYMKRYEIDFPLRHPRYMMPDAVFERQMTMPTSTRLWADRIEVLFRKIIRGGKS